MENQITELERKLKSNKEWKSSTDSWIIEYFEFLGFKCPNDFMKVRLYDFFNLDCVDNNKAEEMILGLSRFLYPEKEESVESSPRRNAQCLILVNLLPDPSEITIEDLISETFFTEEEMMQIFDHITQCFYRSDEYDSRNYKYWNLNSIPKSQRT